MKHKLCSFKSLISSFAFVLSLQMILHGQSAIEGEVKAYLTNLPFTAPKIEAPVFKQAQFSIKDFGGVADGQSINTKAINDAIVKCSESGGGRVVIPAGLWITGPIELKSDVDLHLEKGALVVFSADHSLFPILGNSSKNFVVQAPISGSRLKNIAISGEGLFDGNGATWRPVKKNKMTEGQWKTLVRSGGVISEKGDMWWPSAQAMNAEKYLKEKSKKDITKEDYELLRDFYRPNLLNLDHCKNLLLSEFTLQNSPKFAMSLRFCENVILRKVQVLNDWWAQNGDGLDISACKNVLYYGCTVSAGDDAICMKASGSKESGPVLENIVIADCVVYSGHGGFVIGSNTDGGMNNISVKNCTFVGTDVGLRFKSGPGKGGLVENVFIDGIYMKNILHEAILFEYSYEDGGVVKMKDDDVNTQKIPVFRNIRLNNIYCDGAEKAFDGNALESSALKDVSVTNGTFITKAGFEGSYIEGIQFANLNLSSLVSPLFSFSQAKNVELKDIAFSSVSVFLKVSGANSSDIRIAGTDMKKAAKPFELSEGAGASAVTIIK